MTISATCPGFYLIQGETFMLSKWDFHMIEIVYLRRPSVHCEFQQVYDCHSRLGHIYLFDIIL